MKAASVYDYRHLARKRVPRFLFEYLDGGSYAEVTKERNRADLEALALRQRVLRDVSRIDTNVRLFDHEYRMPVALAPVGLAGMYARRGELQAVRAAEGAGDGRDRRADREVPAAGTLPPAPVREPRTSRRPNPRGGNHQRVGGRGEKSLGASVVVGRELGDLSLC